MSKNSAFGFVADEQVLGPYISTIDGCYLDEQKVITADTGVGHSAALWLRPGYRANSTSTLTITSHVYIQPNDVLVTNVGTGGISNTTAYLFNFTVTATQTDSTLTYTNPAGHGLIVTGFKEKYSNTSVAVATGSHDTTNTGHSVQYYIPIALHTDTSTTISTYYIPVASNTNPFVTA